MIKVMLYSVIYTGDAAADEISPSPAPKLPTHTITTILLFIIFIILTEVGHMKPDLA